MLLQRKTIGIAKQINPTNSHLFILDNSKHNILLNPSFELLLHTKATKALQEARKEIHPLIKDVLNIAQHKDGWPHGAWSIKVKFIENL